MTASLRELGDRAGTVPAPLLDLGALVAVGESRVRRRRRLAVAAVTAVVVAVVGAAALASPGSREAAPPVGPNNRSHVPDSTDPDVVETAPTSRPLTYAVGTTIHWGDRTVDVAEQAPGRSIRRLSLEYLDVTDDGVVFITGLPPVVDQGEVGVPVGPATVWFTDGSEPVRIGTTWGSAVRGFGMASSVEGSTLAWTDPGTTSRPARLVVYDTERMTEVARLGDGRAVPVTPVYDDVVYWSPDRRSCSVSTWIAAGGVIGCDRSTHLMRFDTASGNGTEVSPDEVEADRRSRPGLLAGPSGVPEERRGVMWLRFLRRGDHLVAAGQERDVSFTPTVVLTGRPVRLRLPARFDDPEDLALTQWLDADRVVLAGGGPDNATDLFVCRLSTGTCRPAVRFSDASYTEPGPAGIHG